MERNTESVRSETASQQKARIVSRKLPGTDVLLNLAETFKALGDPTRLQIVMALLVDELCVQDISEVVGLSQSAVSHQLRVLRNLKLVKYRKQGRMVYYSLDDEHIRRLVEQAYEHVTE